VTVTDGPLTPEEWQDAVDAAAGLLALESARDYGLVTGGPSADIARCQELLERGAARGIKPTPDALERFAFSLLQEREAEPE
jgi:hypothetical protein